MTWVSQLASRKWSETGKEKTRAEAKGNFVGVNNVYALIISDSPLLDVGQDSFASLPVRLLVVKKLCSSLVRSAPLDSSPSEKRR